jgi:succinate-semialdehyde dehydrogenase/glutarate-semialdehyde dehydrogenase
MGIPKPVSAGDTVRCENPATRELLGHAPIHSADDARSAIQAAREAQKSWSATRASERVRRILRIRDYIVEEVDAIAGIIAADTGKTRIDALATEVMPSVLGASYYARNTRRFLRPSRIRGGSVVFLNKLSTVHRVPHGVVGVISPWNYPLGIPMHEIIPALLAGNGVVFKTAPETQMVGRKIDEIMAAGGLPQGLFAHLNLPGSTAGEVFLEPGGVDKLFFTGSVAVGKLLMAAAAETLTPLSLELGGNDAMLVCADADLERAVNGAVWAGLQNSGQSCAGVERIYVYQEVYPAFMALLKDRVESLRLGVDRDHQVDIGALCTERQVVKVRQQIDEALALGARVHARADVPPEHEHGNFLPVTVLADVTHEMAVMKEETFGPVLGVMPVADMEEALHLANDSMLGLTGSVWSRDTRAARQLGLRIRAGVITINDHLLSHGLAETPWGGFKESGIGRSHGRQGFDEMTEPQVVVTERLPFLRRNLFWHPYSPALYDGLHGLLDLLYAGDLRRRFQGLRRLLAIAPRMFRK